MCSEKMLWGISENGECYSFQTFAIVFITPENVLVGITGALGTTESPLSKLKHVLRKCSGVSQKMVNARAFKPLLLWSAPLKTY